MENDKDMAHYARVVNDIVIDIVVCDEADWDEVRSRISEEGEWIQCSYNTRGGVYYDPETGEPAVDQAAAIAAQDGRQRKNYPGVTWRYDREGDAFYCLQPHKGWILNKETYIWEPPIPCPDPENFVWRWDGENLNWIKVGPRPPEME